MIKLHTQENKQQSRHKRILTIQSSSCDVMTYELCQVTLIIPFA